MGDASSEMTMRYYVHVQEAELQRALGQVELGLPRHTGPKAGTLHATARVMPLDSIGCG